MPSEGFEPTIPASERPQTYALDRTATGIGLYIMWPNDKQIIIVKFVLQECVTWCVKLKTEYEVRVPENWEVLSMQ
jgi:hypothetical protein